MSGTTRSSWDRRQFRGVFRPCCSGVDATTITHVEHAREHAIPPATCWELLRTDWFGRVALCVDALPTIVPVEYCLDGDEVAICLGQHHVNARAVTDTVVSFAADAVDSVTHAGWTVHVQGIARLSQRSGVVAMDCGQHAHGQIVYITPVLVSGQRLDLCPFGTGLAATALP